MRSPASSPMRVNPSQAVFGVLWGVWYGKITTDLLQASKVGLPWLSVEAAQALYVIASPIWLALLVGMLMRAHRTTSEFPMVREQRFPDGVRQTGILARHILAPILLLWGFLATTYFLFPGDLNLLLVVLGAWHPLIWVLFEVWIVMRS